MPDSTCSLEACTRDHYARGWCQMHYKRWWKNGRTELAEQTHRVCVVGGCDRPWRTREWCALHYQRQMRGGTTNLRRSRQICTVDGCDGYRLSRGWCVKHYERWKRHGSPTARVRGEVVDGKRICFACREDLPVSLFHDGKGGRCITCRAEYQARAERKAKRAEWASANRELMRSYLRRASAARRAAQKGAGAVPFTTSELAARMAFFGNRCWMCLGPFEHVDHVKPLAAGGPHLLANLRPACARCNQSKSGRWHGVRKVSLLSA